MTSSEWAPVHDRQHPPFEAGNAVAVRHGAYSPNKVEPRAAELVAQIENDAAVTWLAEVDRAALWGWARALATSERVQSYVDELSAAADNGVGDLEDKRVQAAYSLLDRAQGRLANMQSRLGFDPLSRARLGRDTAAAQVDMADFLTRMREAAEPSAEDATVTSGVDQ